MIISIAPLSGVRKPLRCGPSVDMKPAWHQLAKITEKFKKEVRIAYMESDENEQDRELFPETSIPNIKLFCKACCGKVEHSFKTS